MDHNQILTAEPSGELLESLYREGRRFPPPRSFKAKAWVKGRKVYARAAEDPVRFWEEAAQELLWDQPWQKGMEGEFPFVRWFVGGKLNVTRNCLDRHVAGAKRHKVALYWEGEPGDRRIYTYERLWREVMRCARALKTLGIKPGDRVTLYMGMVPELVISMLACARIGAVHSVVFGGFSADALRDRLNDAGARLLITQDGAYRRGKVIPLKEYADAALTGNGSVEKVLVYRRIPSLPLSFQEGRDLDWEEVVSREPEDLPAEPFDSEHPLFILYTSGTTGKPKGVLHTSGGYLVGVHLTTKWVFDLKEEDLYFCTADIGWVTGHSYGVYGPLSNGATLLLYEGAPDYPDKDRYWDLVERYRVNILYTSPTFIRTAMKWGNAYPERHDLSSLRLLGTVGEPINPEAWLWYHRVIGKERCPIVDTWWQTETGMILITPLPGAVAAKPGSATLPFPGVRAAIVDEQGNPLPPDRGGYLVITHPWPAMARTLYGDPERFAKVYFQPFPGRYFTGDGGKQDRDGYFWITGRVDDVIKVSGHRLSNIELESTLVAHPSVAEAAVIARHDPITGEAVSAFVVLRSGFTPSPSLEQELKEWVARRIGAIARPREVFFVSDLPKTRSAKIMRRLLRDIAEGKTLGDTTTLMDPAVLEELKQRYIAEGKEEG